MSEEHPPFITVTHGMSGYFAVMMNWNEELGGFYEPCQTGFERFNNKDTAIAEALQWAIAEEVGYRE